MHGSCYRRCFNLLLAWCINCRYLSTYVAHLATLGLGYIPKPSSAILWSLNGITEGDDGGMQGAGLHGDRVGDVWLRICNMIESNNHISNDNQLVKGPRRVAALEQRIAQLVELPSILSPRKAKQRRKQNNKSSLYIYHPSSSYLNYLEWVTIWILSNKKKNCCSCAIKIWSKLWENSFKLRFVIRCPYFVFFFL